MRLLAAAVAVTMTAASSVAPPIEEPAPRVLRLVKPALVRIETHAAATVSVATIGFDQAALEAFARGDVARLLASGQRYPNLGAAQQAITSDLEHEFVANPAPYLKLGDQVSDPYESARVGSGWLADANGFIVTASDVLLDDAAVRAAATDQEREAISADLDDITPGDLGLTVPFSDAQKANLVNAALARAAPTIQVSDIATDISVQLGSVQPGQQKSAHIVVDHSAGHGLGVAVLHVEGPQFASIPLALGSTLRSGAAVIVAGYPAAEAQSGGAGSGAPVAPEADAGTIGDAVAEGGALTSTGYTLGVVGGPALDSRGEVIGVAVKRDGASAIVPISDVARALDAAHAGTRVNAVTEDYRKAAADMSRHWYKRALPIFQSISRRLPDVPWVSDQLQEAAQEIALDHDESPSDRPFAPVAVAAMLFAADAIAVTTVLRRRLLLRSRGG